VVVGEDRADWYVRSVLARAKLISLLPSELIGSVTGLTEGRFPVAAQASYATRATPGALNRRGKRRTLASQGSELRRQLDVLADPGSPVVAVQDGKITRIGTSPVLGRFVQLRDVYGNTYTYANLGSVAKTYLTPRTDAPRGAQVSGQPDETEISSGGPDETDAVVPAGLPLRAPGQTGPRAAAVEPRVVDPDARKRKLIVWPGRAPSPLELLTGAPSVAVGPRDSELRRNLEAARAAGALPAGVPRASAGAKATSAVRQQRRATDRAARPGAATPRSISAVRLEAAQRRALEGAAIVTPAAAASVPRAPASAITSSMSSRAPVTALGGPWSRPPLASWPARFRSAPPAPIGPPSPARPVPAGTPRAPTRVPSAPVGPARTPVRVPFAPSAVKAPSIEQEQALTRLARATSVAWDGSTVYSPYQRRLLGGLEREDVRSRKLRVGSAVVGGTVLGRIGNAKKPHLRFRVRPAGKDTPLIDPTPILDGWRLLDSSAVYRGTGRSALRPGGSSVGRILLQSKDRLIRRVLTSPDIKVHECGQRDIAAGLIDRRVLATLAFLDQEGLDPTVTSLQCGRIGRLTSSGNVSEHETGTAVDIAAINGVPILGHQDGGSVTEQAIRKLLTLQGTMKPHQIISLLSVPGTDNTLALPDHADHIHVGWAPQPGARAKGDTTAIGGALRGSDWDRLMARLNVIENPFVSAAPSASALPAAKKKQKKRGKGR